MEERRLSLRFLSGKCQGSEYVLGDPVEVVVGRSSDVDLILLEGMVSRRHARFVLKEGELIVEDLGSTNGTFVNGEKISRRRLQEGDRVLVGTSILKVVRTDKPVGTVPPRPAGAELLDDVTNSQRSRMSGEIEDVSVPELLELLSTTRQNAVLDLVGTQGSAFITVGRGVIEDAGIDALPDAPAHKCLMRLLGWSRGSYAVRPYVTPDPKRLELKVPQLLVEGLFQLDELAILRQRLPDDGAPLVLSKPLHAQLSALVEQDLDLLQLAHNVGTVDKVIDRWPETDLETVKRLLALLDAGYLRRA
jgi:hypothetical protein